MSDIEVVQQIYAAMAARDLATLAQLVDEACVITQDPALPWGGRHVGHPGFLTFARPHRLDQLAVTTHDLFMADGDVIQVGHTKGTTVAHGTPFDIPEVHRWTIRDGKAVAAHFSIDTAAMLAALEG
jgi:ketosteroid isomerase-like protein